MEFLQVVQSRRAVRQYRDAVPERALVERLIGLAVQAPSAMNLQPWAFVVVSGIEHIADCGRRARDYLLANPDALQLPPEALEILRQQRFEIFYRAPLLVLVLARADSPQAREDCCLAAQTLMLAARDAGLGTCWIGFGRPWLNLAATKSELGIPATCHVVAPIVLGYPLAWPEPHGREPPEVHWLSAVPV